MRTYNADPAGKRASERGSARNGVRDSKRKPRIGENHEKDDDGSGNVLPQGREYEKKRLVKEAKATTKATPALLRCRRRAATATPTQAAAKG